jgi:hypothetical protein
MQTDRRSGQSHKRSRSRSRSKLQRHGTVFAPQAAIEAPSKAAKLSERHLQLLQQHKGPLVKIATHYHVGFGDCLKVIGSSEELGAWKADDAPLMRWNEGDVWTLVTPLPPGEHEFKVRVAAGRVLLVPPHTWQPASFRLIRHLPNIPSLSQLTVGQSILSLADTHDMPSTTQRNVVRAFCRWLCSKPAATWSGKQATTTGW